MKLRVDAETSRRLGKIRQKDTEPELVVRALLRELGARYRVGVRSLPGSPDVANQSRRWAIFVHGCFWHRHAGCSRTTTPKRNRQFWLEKFEANKRRDRRAKSQLTRAGFSTLTVWECECRDPDRLRGRLADFLSAG